MTWNIVINSSDCDWLFTDLPEATQIGRIEKLCSHPESESRFCAENTCPKKLQSNKREYQKHEFCLAMKCSWFQHGVCTLKPGCAYTARQFHYWLKDNEFEIIKASNEVNVPCGNTKCPEYNESDPDGTNCALFFPANKEQCAHYRPYTAKEA